jgi:hypothetical protein
MMVSIITGMVTITKNIGMEIMIDKCGGQAGAFGGFHAIALCL